MTRNRISLLKTLEQKTLDGGVITAAEAQALVEVELVPLCAAADRIRAKRRFDTVDLCCILNAKSGRCAEDCRYCAQSAACVAPIDEYPLLPFERILEIAHRAVRKKIGRFAVVTSGRKLSKTELDTLVRVLETLRAEGEISLCASLGLMTLDELRRLKNAGLARFHHNLETSRRFFPSICTTHTYDDKIATIQNALEAGLEVCSGGIFGMGETWADRIEMAVELRRLGINSVPINVLVPIPGTALAARPFLSAEEVRRIVAIYRFLLPDAAIRLAGGRKRFPDFGESFFQAGADAAITGDMLTTSGVSVDSDRRLLERLGRTEKKL